jgi:hypothetical protein
MTRESGPKAAPKIIATTASIESNNSARLVAGLDAETLRHLAHIAFQRSQGTPRFTDPVQAAEELAVMFSAGGIPTCGWWRRHRVPRVVRQWEASQAEIASVMAEFQGSTS